MSRERFSVATFNTKNLVNAETNYYQKKDGSWNRYSKAAFERKVTWLALQLAKMDADHVALQEVFHAEALQEVARKYKQIIEENGLKQEPYSEILHIPNDNSGEEDPRPGLAYLGRKPVVSEDKIQTFSDNPIVLSENQGLSFSLGQTSRPISIIEVDIGHNRTTVLVNAHLKSKRPTLEKDSDADDPANFLFLDRSKGAISSLIRRAGEALALRRELLRLMRGSDTPVIVLGDLNDSAGAVTSEVIRGEAPWRHEPNLDIKRGFWDVELYSAAQTHLRRSEKSDFTTHVYNGHHGTIDHIFFSQEFYYRNRGPSRLGDLDYVRAFNDHLTDLDLLGAPRDADASDHGQLVAYFSHKAPSNEGQ